MSFFQSSDWHYNSIKPYFEQHKQAINSAIAESIGRETDAFFLLGDFAGQDAPHEQDYKEQLAIANSFELAANSAPTFALLGNHDWQPQFEIFRRLKTKYPLRIIDDICVLDKQDRRGRKLKVLALPWLGKAEFVTFTKCILSNIEASLVLNNLIKKYLDSESIDVVIGHYAIIGARCGSYEIESKDDLCIDPSIFKNYDLKHIGFGHIHKRQSFYAGSPVPLDFGESQPKGYLEDNRFREIKSWDMKQIELDVENGKLKEDSIKNYQVENTYCRIVLNSLDKTHLSQGDKLALKEMLEVQGALSTDIRTKHSKLIRLREESKELQQLESIEEQIGHLARANNCQEELVSNIIDFYREVHAGAR